MKKITLFVLAITLIFTICVTAQTGQKQADQTKTIPTGVKTVLDRSCSACHSEKSQGMAKMKVNFSKWNEYSSDKIVAKGKAVCDEVSKNNMPPKRFLTDNPAAVLSDTEKKLICDWTGTLSSGK
jgi:cytochrome c5